MLHRWFGVGGMVMQMLVVVGWSLGPGESRRA